MCGIAGILSNGTISPETIRLMTGAISHRGPDAQATFLSENGTCALGHARLSVIDLSTAANQPMHSADGNLTIVFNGEIYNFKEIRKKLHQVRNNIVFSTQSDTETILHAFAVWGPDMVKELQGMFAIAIYNHAERSIYFYRDRLGKKPLYYFESDDVFVFASEIKALLKHPDVQAKRTINEKAIHRFLHLGYIPQPDTIFHSIKKFPAGDWGIKKIDSKLVIQEYWSARQILLNRNVIHDFGAAKNELNELLNVAVQRRLISDVPVGAFLSGGTDSSLVTAISARHHTGKLKTFSIGFRESQYDETRYAEEVAKHLGTDHHSHVLSENEAINLLETYLHHFDEPFADTSAIPTMLVSQLTRKQVTVALTGDGGDELFHGYGAHTWAKRLSNPFFRLLQNPLGMVARNYGNDRMKRVGKLLERVNKKEIASHIFSQEQYFFSQSELPNLLQSNQTYEPFLWEGMDTLSPSEQQALFDIEYYLRDDLLVKVDRASMYYALECRCPLLDAQLVEFALNLSPHLKTQKGERKWILKEILKDHLPNELIFRPKWGFSIPLPNWLNGKLSYLIDDFLNEQIVKNFNVVQYDVVRDLLNRFKSGEQHLYNRLWVLTVLHKWLRENG